MRDKKMGKGKMFVCSFVVARQTPVGQGLLIHKKGKMYREEHKQGVYNTQNKNYASK
jgi:hypothetical protein